MKIAIKKAYKENKLKIITVLFGVVALLACVAMISEWGAEHKFQKPILVLFKVETQPLVVDREPVEVISPLAREVIEPKTDLSPIEQKIVDMWGERYGYIAVSVFRCESGLRADAVNWNTRDIGIAQINYPIWKEPIEDEFGYTLVDLFDVDKNLEVAYWIWDRADGEVGNNAGSFEPWVAFNNGGFVHCIE